MIKRKSPWIALVIIAILASLIVVYFQGQSELNAPTGNVIENTTPTEPAPDYHFKKHIVANEEAVVYVPEDWTRVTKDGFATFIHSPSATSCQVQAGNYTPSLLLTNASDMQQKASNNGYIMNEFQWLSKTSYYLMYQKMTDDSSTIYYEIVNFDRDSVVNLIFTVKSEHYDAFSDLIISMINEFEYVPTDAFPDGLTPLYCEAGKYEFVAPDTWSVAQSDNSYIVQDTETATTFSIVAAESTANYSETSKLDYTAFVSKSRPNYMLLSYNADSNVIFAESSYSTEGVAVRMTQYMIATGTHEYIVTFETQSSLYESQLELMSELFRCFRYYK